MNKADDNGLRNLNNTLTQKDIIQKLHYNQESGVFIWLVSDSPRVQVGDIAGSLHSSGYIHIQISGVKYKAHRLVWLYMTGRFPESFIDHINTNRLDNRWINLREATRNENNSNRSLSKASSSGVKGVSYRKDCNKYACYIGVDGKLLHLGLFDTLEEASEERYRYAKQLHKNFFNNKTTR